MESLLKKEIFCEFFDSLAFPVGVLGKEQRLLAANKAFIEAYQKGRDGIMGKPCYKVLFQSDEPCDASRCPIPFVFTEKRPVTVEKQRIGSKEASAWEELTYAPILSNLGEIEYIVVTIRDISKFKTVEAALRKTRDFFEKIIESSVNAIVVADMEGKVILMNESARKLFGFKDSDMFNETRMDKHYLPGEAKEIMRKLRSESFGGVGKLPYRETSIRDVRGREIPVGMTASIIYEEGKEVATMAILQDLRPRIEAEKELEKARMQLIQSEKLASIGRLAAGVAHEINNPLGGILMYGHLVLEDLPEGSPLKRNLEKIIDQAERCKKIVQGLLDFSRQAEPEMTRLDVNEILRQTLSILEEQALFQDIQIQKALSPELPPIRGDKSQLLQVFMNLALNAAEAMDGKGTLTVETKQENGEVVVRVKDTGCGIAPENLGKIFEPFFSAKARDNRGTGLGLAISHGIITRHRGTITVQSEVGKGSVFTVRLPSESVT